jgi:hypothetical protein
MPDGTISATNFKPREALLRGPAPGDGITTEPE